MSYTLPELSYAHDALEPHFDAQTMQIHHQRHHQGYVNNLNNAIAGTEAEQESLEDILQNISKYTTAVRNNGGGHYNHALFWETLSPSPKTSPTGKLADEINKVFGSLENFKEQFKQTGLTRFGSGWAWLIVKYNGTIGITSTANQDNPLMDTNLTDRGFPILGIDVWEHAYYLKYQNKRAEYLEAFWSVLDWTAVEQKYEAALAKVQ
ncbi:superoxide dismutase [Flavilitoribacter nigricans]|uniref:Superoxide dismutase n=1 Tax=Flavilitoribacter nigricans (strain ATCC 23147 / DSM 23189 / NBRC 102662 / NCIMB 1420 / SS-2) TaxID=1122177 RepID=A0A2D0NBJ4_FLAN2|nr:superoxide dismutase [Flavilitoribacter nigricans]PHN05740.1 superoxide dismutase [Flavilitoribacter nigricans DSM 23189 = NBRC 102662]